MYKKFEIKNIISNFTGQNRIQKTNNTMELKKSPKADMGKNKLLFVEIGLIAALSVSLFAFNYETGIEPKEKLAKNDDGGVNEIELPSTNFNEPPPPPEPTLEVSFSDQIDIVDDEIQVDDAFIIAEDDEDWGVEQMDYYEAGEVEEEVVEEEAIPFQLVEEKPSFQGGDANQFSKWVNQRLVYPEIAKENGVQGRVTLQFTVEKDGSITKVKVLRGVDPSLDKEAIRVVSSSPKWKPGKQRDRAVPVTYTFPVIFQLR